MMRDLIALGLADGTITNLRRLSDQGRVESQAEVSDARASSATVIASDRGAAIDDFTNKSGNDQLG